jgi:biotin carboxyl carrier protein
METTLSSSLDGRVVEVLVKPGDQVEVGDLLMAIEP